jgi:ABC-type antimicrobial peptide transport system permease subunit
LLPPGFSGGIAIAPLLLVRPNSRSSDLASALEAVRQFYRDDPTFKLNGGALYVSQSLDPEAALERPGRTVEVVVLLTFSAILAALGLVAVLGSLLRLLQTRRYSIALERSLGAQRTFVLAEVLLEGMLLVMPGVLLGIAAFGLYSGPLTGGGAVLFDRQLTLSGHLSAIITFTAFVLTLAISIYPAVAAASIKPALLLRGE